MWDEKFESGGSGESVLVPLWDYEEKHANTYYLGKFSLSFT